MDDRRPEPSRPEPSRSEGSPAEAVLRLAAEVARELRPARAGAAAQRVDLDSSLERDLGLDSLGRAELVARIERGFGVSLPERVLGEAETPADLVQALAAARGAAAGTGGPAPSGSAGSPAGKASAAALGARRPAAGAAPQAAAEAAAEADPAVAPVPEPHRAQTLAEVLEWHGTRHAERRHLLFYPGDGEPVPLTYGGLLRQARQAAAGLRAAGVERGQAVALMLPSGPEYFVAFCGALLAGAVPVPLYPPARRSQIEEHLRRQAGILTVSQAVALVTFPEVMTVARLLRAQVEGLHRVTTVAELTDRAGGPSAAAGGAGSESAAIPAAGTAPAAGDLAFLQFTSGSTGRPKGVMLTHSNLLANVRAIGETMAITSRDVVVSWLPLYHDMGLIGAWMASLYYGMPLVLMSPLSFLARPARWLQALSRHRGTLAAAPNFAYELCARKIADDEIAGIDLSSWRCALNGAEPVSPDAIRRFVERFRPYGFRPEAMAPVYGLAECSLALALPPPGRGPLLDLVEREAFTRSGRAAPALPGSPLPLLAALEALAAPAPAGGPAAAAGPAGGAHPAAAAAASAAPPAAPVLRFVACGVPVAGHELRIVDAAGNEVGERQEGRLQFRGPSATAGYFRDPEATRRLRQGSWLDSGDRAYVVGREVFLTGRDKDIIIRAGRNLYPHELEEAVGDLPGIRKGCVAVFGVPDRDTGTERLVLVAEARDAAEVSSPPLRDAVQDAVVALLGEPADEVVLVPPQSVPKTSSGKIRRAAARELYLSGHLGRGSAATGLQLTHLALEGVRVQLGRAARAAWAPLYSAYVWAVFVLVGAPAWLAVALVPGPRRRRLLARAGARLMCRCAGLPLRTGGLEHLAAARELAAGKPAAEERAAEPAAERPEAGEWAAEERTAGRPAAQDRGPGRPAAGEQGATDPAASPGAGQPSPPGVLLAVNHSSYLDGIALTAALPPDFGFVAKRELDASFLTRVLMRRLGALMVERFDTVQSAGEVPRAAAALAAGESLILFPEGTFKRAPGLLPFRMGAFLAAAQAGAPIVPAVLRGTRSVFRDETVIFRRGAVELLLLPPVAPDGDDWPAALRLRDRVRTAMLEHAGEPDLAERG